MNIELDEYQIKLVDEIDDPENDNISVNVLFKRDVGKFIKSGELYTGWYFTVNNIIRTMEYRKQTGESNFGQYVWAANMIIVERITPEVIQESIKNMIEKSEFTGAFMLINLDR